MRLALPACSRHWGRPSGCAGCLGGVSWQEMANEDEMVRRPDEPNESQ